MEKKSLKEEADQLMKIEGNTKGSEILSLARYISQKYGKESLQVLEKEMEKLGYPLEFNKIRPMEWYRESLNVLAFLVAKKIFGWKDLFEVGYQTPRFSIGVRLFMRLISPKIVFEEANKSWKKFLDVGEIESVEYNEKERYAILRLKNYKFHPEMCQYYAGFFQRMLQYTQKSKNISVEERKCMFKGDPYHEYVLRW
jgi:predicted hydrocarbon binding protein